MTEFSVGDRVRVRALRATTAPAGKGRSGTVVMVNRNLGGGTILSYQVRLDGTARAHAVLQPGELESESANPP